MSQIEFPEEEELRQLEELKRDADKLVTDINEFAAHMYRLCTASLKPLSRADKMSVARLLDELLARTYDLAVRLDQFKMKLVELVCRASDEIHAVFRHYLYEYLPAKYHSVLAQRDLVSELLREGQVTAALVLFVDYVSDMLELAAQLFAIARGLAEFLGRYYEEFRKYYEQIRQQYEKSREIQEGLLPAII